MVIREMVSELEEAQVDERELMGMPLRLELPNTPGGRPPIGIPVPRARHLQKHNLKQLYQAPSKTINPRTSLSSMVRKRRSGSTSRSSTSSARAGAQ